MDAPHARFRALVRAGALDPVGEPELVTSYSNDAWYVRSASAGDVVLRVCWIGDRERLLRETAVGRALPVEVGYPEVLASGALTVDGEAIAWMTSRRLSGRSLRTAWPELDEHRRERALREVVAPLRALHRWRPPARLRGDSVRRHRARTRRPSSAAPSCRCRWTGYAIWSLRPPTMLLSTGP